MAAEANSVMEFIDPSEQERKRKIRDLLEMWQAAEEPGLEYVEEDELSDARRHLQDEVMKTLGYGRHRLEVKFSGKNLLSYFKNDTDYSKYVKNEADGSAVISFDGGIQFNDWSREKQRGLLICLDSNDEVRLIFDDLKERPITIANIPREFIADMRWRRITDLIVDDLEKENGAFVNEYSFLDACDVATEQDAGLEVIDFNGIRWTVKKVSTRKGPWEIVLESVKGPTRKETFNWREFEAREPRVRMVRDREQGV